jgi:hypothetical protein
MVLISFLSRRPAPTAPAAATAARAKAPVTAAPSRDQAPLPTSRRRARRRSPPIQSGRL